MMVNLGTVLPEQGANETRSITFHKTYKGISAGVYCFLEMFCIDKTCDCRRAMISIRNENNEPQATLNYGWENLDFYANWMRNRDHAHDIPGINLYPYSYQGPNCHDFLEIFRGVMEVGTYQKRIIKHYFDFKKELKRQIETGEIHPQLAELIEKNGLN